jgi:Eukaryotic rRNA processing protein EBP2
MAKKSKRSKTAAAAAAVVAASSVQAAPAATTATAKITLQDLYAQSDSDDDSSMMPPESEWNAEAKALKQAIESGKFDDLLERADHDNNDESFEEVDLDDEEDTGDAPDEDGEGKEVEMDQENEKSDEEDAEDEEDAGDNEENADDNDEEAESDDDKNNTFVQKPKKPDSSARESNEDDDEEEEEENDEGDEHVDNELDQTNDGSEDDDDDDDDEDDDSDNEQDVSVRPTQSQTKALQIVVGGMMAEKKDWPWAETFSIVTKTPLPFDGKTTAVAASPEEAATAVRPSIHDDLQREVAFYDLALEAVEEAKVRCRESQIPFSRPDDFLAEMVKTDGTYSVHVARSCLFLL